LSLEGNLAGSPNHLAPNLLLALAHVGGLSNPVRTWRAPITPAEYNSIIVPKIEEPQLQKPKVDPHLQSAGERVKAAAEELERLDIADPTGKRVRKDLPKDMRGGTSRDFGG
jgi:hypothetical protein